MMMLMALALALALAFGEVSPALLCNGEV